MATTVTVSLAETSATLAPVETTLPSLLLDTLEVAATNCTQEQHYVACDEVNGPFWSDGACWDHSGHTSDFDVLCLEDGGCTNEHEIKINGQCYTCNEAHTGPDPVFLWDDWCGGSQCDVPNAAFPPPDGWVEWPVSLVHDGCGPMLTQPKVITVVGHQTGLNEWERYHPDVRDCCSCERYFCPENTPGLPTEPQFPTDEIACEDQDVSIIPDFEWDSCAQFPNCNDEEDDRRWMCMYSCKLCDMLPTQQCEDMDLSQFPDSPAANCAEGLANGLCAMDAFQQVCKESCGLCGIPEMPETDAPSACPICPDPVVCPTPSPVDPTPSPVDSTGYPTASPFACPEPVPCPTPTPVFTPKVVPCPTPTPVECPTPAPVTCPEPVSCPSPSPVSCPVCTPSPVTPTADPTEWGEHPTAGIYPCTCENAKVQYWYATQDEAAQLVAEDEAVLADMRIRCQCPGSVPSCDPAAQTEDQPSKTWVNWFYSSTTGWTLEGPQTQANPPADNSKDIYLALSIISFVILVCICWVALCCLCLNRRKEEKEDAESELEREPLGHTDTVV